METDRSIIVAYHCRNIWNLKTISEISSLQNLTAHSIPLLLSKLHILKGLSVDFDKIKLLCNIYT